MVQFQNAEVRAVERVANARKRGEEEGGGSVAVAHVKVERLYELELQVYATQV